MSEYQYYEFLALDRPLTAKEMARLRAISTRATISLTSFSNHYEWGDLKADPLKLLERYFDVFVYVANWSTHWIALRLPKGALDAKRAKPYLDGDYNRLDISGETVLLSLSSEDGDPDDDFDDGAGWMASLAPVRGELLRGDLRPLYLAWLAAATEEAEDDDELEPPVPPGMGDLTPAQLRLAEFLRVDDDLLAVAAEGSGSADASLEGLEDWIAALPSKDKDRLLVSIARGTDALAGAELMRRFQASRNAPPDPPRRTVGALWAKARARREEYQREQAHLAEERRQKQAAAEARARDAHLKDLAGRQENAWKRVHTLIAERTPNAYDETVTLLRDLRDVAQRADNVPDFRSKVAAIAQHHARKPTLQERLRNAGLID